MDENKALVGELRSYLSSAQHCAPSPLESEQVRQLKRDLNLAARVGQQLLMQLQQADKQREKHEVEITRLKAANAQLSQENKQLAVEHDLISENLEQQESEIAKLTDQLKLVKHRADQLGRAQASARALEREVNMLETTQQILRAELESSLKHKVEAEKLVRKLTTNMVGQLAGQLHELRSEVMIESADAEPSNMSSELSIFGCFTALNTSMNSVSSSDMFTPSKISTVRSEEGYRLNNYDSSSETTRFDELSRSRNSSPGFNQRNDSNALLSNLTLDDLPSLTIDNDTTPTDITSFDNWASPNDTATPIRPLLARSNSHESIFSPVKALPTGYLSSQRKGLNSKLINMPFSSMTKTTLQPANLQPANLQPPTLKPIVSAMGTLEPVSGESYVESGGTWKSHTARDKLSSMRIMQATRDRRKWGFSAFR